MQPYRQPEYTEKDYDFIEISHLGKSRDNADQPCKWFNRPCKNEGAPCQELGEDCQHRSPSLVDQVMDYIEFHLDKCATAKSRIRTLILMRNNVEDNPNCWPHG